MGASIRGHQGKFKIFKNGKDAEIVNVTSIDISQDSSFSRSMYVGNAVPEGDQTQEGWSGSLEVEVKGPEVDEFIDALVSQNLAGIGVEDVTFISEEYYSDGRIQAYVYFDCQYKMSKRVSGLNEKQTKRLEFQASGRMAL